MRKNKAIKYAKTELEKALEQDFQYKCDLDYNTSTDCESHGCNEEGICRCSTIEDLTIKSVDLNSVTKEFFRFAKDNEFTEYCIDRAFHALKIWDTNAWNAETTGGYYGEEIGGVYIASESRERLHEVIQSILDAKTNKEKLTIILKLEYGYVLPDLENAYDWKITEVFTHSIVAGNSEHYKKLDLDIVKAYDDYTLPIGVCLKKDGRYRLIDGYHRYLSAVNKKLSKVKIVVGEIVVGEIE